MKDQVIIHPADQGPWGKPKGGGGSGGGGWQPGGGSRPPKGPSGDFDDFLGDIKRHLKNLFGGHQNHRGLLVGVFALFALWLASGIYQLQPGEQGVILRFGKFQRLDAPGLRYHLPSPFEDVVKVNVESKQNETLGGDPSSPPHGGSNGTGDDQMLMLTGDENIINVSLSVQWKVSDARQFAFNLTDPVITVRHVAESAMREIIGQSPVEDAMTTGKAKISYDALKLTQATLDSYHAGIQVTAFNLLDASFPQAVVEAARDVQAAQADQESAVNTAQGYTNDIIPRARGKAERIIKDAEGYKQKVVAEAQGQSARFLAVYAQYKLAEDVTRKRIYLETMERILAGTNKIIMEDKTGVVPYLPLPELKPAGAPDTLEKGAAQ